MIMRWLYTAGLLIGIPALFVLFIVLAARLDDFFMRRFGKPPAWVGVISIICWLYVFARMAWEHAGKFIK